MLTFLFWNVNGKPVEAAVTRMAKANGVDVLVLAECSIAPSKLLNDLNRNEAKSFELPFSQCPRIAIYTRFESKHLVALRESDHFTIRRLKLPRSEAILLVAAHLPSKLHVNRESEPFRLERFARKIRQVESEAGHTRTIVIGDLNANPYEAGLLAASGLNGAMTREIASRKTRTIDGEEYPFFFNPMWGMFGDGTKAPPGTYYYARAEDVTPFWNMYDQVLLRPDLLHRFDTSSVKILSAAGGVPLVGKKGHPRSSVFSDHLPIVFQIDL